MTLYINTADQNKIMIALKDKERVLFKKEFLAARSQAEKLLPEIEKLLVRAKLKLPAIKKIEVENYGGSFTALRIGVITANALGYALGVPVVAAREMVAGKTMVKSAPKSSVKKAKNFSVVKPIYDREPNIGK